MITIDPTSLHAPYEQVKAKFVQLVADGTLPPGHKLPTVRKLAGVLGLAPNTVARAYRELEAAGVIATRGRAGTFVRGDGHDRAARHAAAEYAEKARALGLSATEAVELVQRALATD